VRHSRAAPRLRLVTDCREAAFWPVSVAADQESRLCICQRERSVSLLAVDSEHSLVEPAGGGIGSCRRAEKPVAAIWGIA